MLLLRHASAGEPMSSPWLDCERTLDEVGLVQARDLRQALVGFYDRADRPRALMRAASTVRPLAEALGLELECRDALAPDSSQGSALTLLDELPVASLSFARIAR